MLATRVFVWYWTACNLAVGTGTTPTYEYGYGRAATTGYDASKTYYQQAAAAGQTQGYAAATGYEQAAPKTAYSTTAYAARTAAQPQPAQQVNYFIH